MKQNSCKLKKLHAKILCIVYFFKLFPDGKSSQPSTCLRQASDGVFVTTMIAQLRSRMLNHNEKYSARQMCVTLLAALAGKICPGPCACTTGGVQTCMKPRGCRA
jgi:hypothetical protein